MVPTGDDPTTRAVPGAPDAVTRAAAPPADPSVVPAGTALVVVDVQGSFVDGDDPAVPKAGDAQARAALLARIVAIIDACRASAVPVVTIQEVHKPSLVDIGRELDGAEGPHALEGDPATELAPGIAPRPDEYLIRKRRYSAFFATELDLVLRSLGARTVLLVGGMTDVCIHYTAVDAHQHDYRIRVVEDCVIGTSDDAHEAALRAMTYLQRDARVRSADVLATLLPSGTRAVRSGPGSPAAADRPPPSR
ncbi:isochorismatase family cysteine hydrolase [Patulibacter sp. NPDC049589]|uniref:cysteine hydrolase family protein n=1 Tax=Patulibacter sp. NPDC049589 TaxID=3154731 RepID=UPI003411F767